MQVSEVGLVGILATLALVLFRGVLASFVNDIHRPNAEALPKLEARPRGITEKRTAGFWPGGSPPFLLEPQNEPAGAVGRSLVCGQTFS